MKYLDKANKYIEDVISGKIIVCDEVKMACQRQINDLKRQNTDEFPFYFDTERAEKPCKFIERFKHVKGRWKGNNLILEPFQCFIITTLFGWHFCSDHNKRRFSLAYIELPRKNGKSILAGGICLYSLMVDKLEPTPEIYVGATSLDQADEVFKPSKEMIDSASDIKHLFKIETFAKSIRCGRNNGFIKAVVSKGKDGKSPSLFVVDEFHQALTDELLESFTTGMGSRPSGLGIIVTTAGKSLTSPCKEMHDHMIHVLNGSEPEERDFAMIYTIPQGLDWKDYNNWKLANPNYGVSVDDDFLAKQYRTATTQVSKQNDCLTKNLNVWCSANNAWMNMAKYDECAEHITPEDLKDKKCVIGLDLSEKIDLTAAVLCFYDNTDVWVFPKFYVPREAVEKQRGHKGIYETAEKLGLLTVIEGEVMDLQYVKNDLDTWRDQFKCNDIVFDPWHARFFIQQLEADGYKCIEVKPNVQIMSEAAKQCEADIYSKHFHHDGNVFLKWNFSNIVAHRDNKQNIYPRKEREENKIDGCMSIFTAYDSIMRERMKPAEITPGMIFF